MKATDHNPAPLCSPVPYVLPLSLFKHKGAEDAVFALVGIVPEKLTETCLPLMYVFNLSAFVDHLPS